MAVTRFLVLCCWLSLSLTLLAQKSFATFDTTAIEIDFLSSYYAQDGEHSPVTGGSGTEELSTVDNRIIVSFATDSLHKVRATQKVNSISSASTDRIDGVSSASKHDAHLSFAVSFSEIIPKRHLISTWNGSFSAESDYASKGIGYGLQKVSKNANHRIGLNANAYFDDWVMIFPEELRDETPSFPSKDFRNSYSLVLHGNNVVNKRTLFYWNIGATFQHGLLSTPFHRVYFADTTGSGLEALPYQRFKTPVSFGTNLFLFHFLVLKPSYRFYTDNFGVLSHTLSMKAVIKLSPYVNLKGALRFADQKGSRYFDAYAQHSIEDVYRTSDYDLSTFSSQYYNMGISYAPLKGIMAIRRFSIDLLEFRYTNYKRSDGLISNMFSFYVKSSLKKR